MPSAAAATTYFANYKQRRSRVPSWLWVALRVLTLGITLAVAAALFISPVGLTLFWGLLIPIVPAILVIAPGVWRQICPMALMNQLPVLTGKSLSRDLPDRAREWAFTIAVGSFVTIVALRVPLFNHQGSMVGTGVLLMLVLALTGGLVFKGRSGWCGTFCPLGPIQRNYGHAPLLLVSNGYCETCVGCQKHCYDFNPRAAVFEDLYDSDAAYAGQRRFFMAMMPGVVVGYFVPPAIAGFGVVAQVILFLSASCVSVGLYQGAVSFGHLNPFRAANLFACIAIALFYWFAGPLIVDTIRTLSGIALPPWVASVSRLSGVMLAGMLCYRGWLNEMLFKTASEASHQLSVDRPARSLRERLAAATAALVTDAESGTAFPVAPQQTLLEAMETAHVPIHFGCRAGLCGADAVIVQSGQENLSPITADEQATLQRLGLEGTGRLACMCQVRGAVVIDRDIRHARREFAARGAAPPEADGLKAKGIAKVVIVGNGVAGITVADNLRRRSESAEIILVTDEPHHFYNRMAVGRVLYGRGAMDGLMLLPEDWYAENRIEVWRNTVAVGIDRTTHALQLATGESLPYDALVLATGADPSLPSQEFAEFSNGFALRSAADALAVRMWAQRHSSRRAVVIGGGVLGVEAADALRMLGMQVTLLQQGDRLMERQLDEQGASRLAQYLGHIGIEVRLQARVALFEGEDAIERILLEDGSAVTGDFFVACMGIRPRVDLATSCGLEVRRGIVVDGCMRSSDPAIYAVGDVAEPPGGVGGLWPVAVAEAAACVSGLVDGTDAYQVPRLFVQLKCDGIDLRSFGHLEVSEGDEVISARDDAAAWWRFVLRDGALVSAVLVGPPGSGRDFDRVVQAGKDLAPVIEELRQGRIEALAGL